MEYLADFIQNLAPISLCILSVLIFLMKCKPTEMQTKYYSFLLKHFFKNVKTSVITELLTQNSVCNFVNYIDLDLDLD